MTWRIFREGFWTGRFVLSQSRRRKKRLARTTTAHIATKLQQRQGPSGLAKGERCQVIFSERAAAACVYLTSSPNFSGLDTSGVSGTVVTNLTWDSVKRLRDVVKGKLLLKGPAGVGRVPELLRGETRAAMQQLGTPTVKDITPAIVRRL